MKRTISNTVKSSVVAAALLLTMAVAVAAADFVTAADDKLLATVEQSDRVFKRIKIGDKIVFFHQKMIDGAIAVEFADDYWDRSGRADGDRNMYLDGLYVSD